MIINNLDKPWNWIYISSNQFIIYKRKKYQIVKWYKRMKLIRKLWLVIEVMTIEQMKPNGNYIRSIMNNFF